MKNKEYLIKSIQGMYFHIAYSLFILFVVILFSGPHGFSLNVISSVMWLATVVSFILGCVEKELGD